MGMFIVRVLLFRGFMSGSGIRVGVKCWRCVGWRSGVGGSG